MSINVQDILRRELLPFIGPDNTLRLSENIHVKYLSLEFGCSSSEKTNKDHLTNIFVPLQIFYRDKSIATNKTIRSIRIRSQDSVDDIKNTLIGDALSVLSRSGKKWLSECQEELLDTFKAAFPSMVKDIASKPSTLDNFLQGNFLKELVMDQEAMDMILKLHGRLVPFYPSNIRFMIYQESNTISLFLKRKEGKKDVALQQPFVSWTKMGDMYMPEEVPFEIVQRCELSIQLQN